MKNLLLTVSLLTLIACGGGKHDHSNHAEGMKKEAKTMDMPVKQLESSEVFKAEMGAMLSFYFETKDFLVGSDAASASAAAAKIASASDGLSYGLKPENQKAAQAIIAEIKAAAVKASSTKDLAKVREAFEPLSMGFVKLVETFGSPNAEVYQQHCPMAFNDKGADWLSRENAILNPYFGNKMLKCGVVVKKIEARS